MFHSTLLHQLEMLCEDLLGSSDAIAPFSFPQDRFAQFDDIVGSGDGYQQHPVIAHHAAVLGRVEPRSDRHDEREVACAIRQEPIGVSDDPRSIAIAPGCGIDRRRGDVDAMEFAAGGRAHGREMMALSATGIEDRAGDRCRAESDDRFDDRRGVAGIEKAPAGGDRLRGVSRIRRLAILRLQEIAVPASREVERVAPGAHEAARLLREGLVTFADGTEQSDQGVVMMPEVRRIVPAIALAILCCALAALPSQLFASLAPPPDGEQWTTLQVDEMTIFSNATDELTLRVATSLIRMRDAVAHITKLNVRSPVPTRVFIFRDEASFVAYRNVFMGERAKLVDGVFVSTRDMNYVLLRADMAEGIDRVVYHELTHSFIRNTISGLPFWFDEGIAEFYSTFVPLAESVKVGLPPAEHLELLRGEGLMPLRQLLQADRSRIDYREKRAGVFYAQSWLFVHYLLLDNPERHGQLGEFLTLLDEQTPLETAFTRAFHCTFQQMELELRQVLGRPAVKFVTYSLEDLDSRDAGDTHPVRHDELLAALGDLLAHGGTEASDDAAGMLTAALGENPHNATAMASLASIKAAAGRTAEAETLFAAATAGAATDRTYLLYGESIIARQKAMTAPEEELQRARVLFQKALAVNPNSPRAHAGLGATYTYIGQDAKKGITELEKSLALAPDQDDAAFNLALLYSRLGQKAEAEKLVNGVLTRDADADTLRRARENLLFADLKNANDLMHDKRYDEAIALWRSVMKATTNEELRQQVSVTLAEAEQYRLRAEQAAELQSAVTEANTGRYASALKRVERLIPLIEDQDLLKMANEFRAQVLEYARKKRP
jgi:tetratricopeptide (TPR) repeat protein